ncbi:MAG: transposase [Chloroflexi bacterium]|nr:transposase [Chloroflexota bacterium]
MVVRQQTSEEIKRNCIGRLAWQTAGCDDAGVAKAIHQGEEVDAVYNLDEVGLLDEFFHFLELVRVFPLIEGMQLPGVERVLIPVTQFVLLYVLKVLFGIESMNALPPLLLSNVAIMTLIGFNAHQVVNGFTRRGDDRRRKKPKQGPLTPQCLAQNICKLTVEQMMSFFNGVVRLIVGMGFVRSFRGRMTVALDGSKLPTTKSYEGRGCLKVEGKVKDKDTGKLVKVVKYIFGWKVLVLIEVRTRLPLAAKVVKIEEYEGRWLVPLVKQAQANLGDKARIVKVVVDRGYLDGEDLWQVDQKGIIFVIVAKSGMAVREDAKALAREGKVVERVEVVRHGHGRNATTEELKTRLVGIEGLTTYDDYGTEEHARQKNRRDFEGNAINAVVVLAWENSEQEEEKGPVYLTNGSVKDPFAVFDDYDWRSVIENGIFKEGKHPWHLAGIWR